MKTVTEKSSKVLSDLIVINNDRYEGYRKASEEAKDADLKSLFSEYSLQSQKFGDELKPLVNDSNKLPKEDETKNTGKLYRVWMDVKNAMASNNRKSVLSSCEYGEDVAKKTYDDVLEHAEELSTEALTVIRRQRSELQASHDKIKAMRDSA